jgi:3'(2'), 5'-bisphosphate nucleotidase
MDLGDSPVTWQRELEIAERLARQAGAVIRRYHGTDVAVDKKAGNEPVTRADREASELIVGGLSLAFPDDVVISEEAPDDPRRLDPEARVWFVDPLDGTADFIRGRAGFAVMIGLRDAGRDGGRPSVGVVYHPVTDRLFLAAPDTGAWLVEPGPPGGPPGRRRLHCSRIDDPARIRLVASRSHRTAEIDAVKGALGIADELNIGSVGLKLGLIALAERDLYVNPSSKSRAWDTCAPEALLEAAGGKITDLYGEPLAYTAPELRNMRGLLASNGAVHAAVLERLRPLFPAPPPA